MTETRIFVIVQLAVLTSQARADEFIYRLWREAGSDLAFLECCKFIADSNDQREISLERARGALRLAQALI